MFKKINNRIFKRNKYKLKIIPYKNVRSARIKVGIKTAEEETYTTEKLI